MAAAVASVRDRLGREGAGLSKGAGWAPAPRKAPRSHFPRSEPQHTLVSGPFVG